MLKKRIIPCLDIKDGKTVKGISFIELREVGDPVKLAKKYVLEGADELIFLDITATVENRKMLTNLVHRIAKEINIPFTVGGGINSLKSAKDVIEAGADKVSVNSAAIKNPELVKEISQEFGSQCTVIAIDARREHDTWYVYIKGGREKTEWKALEWGKKVQELGAGEILLTSMNQDGTKSGFDLELTDQFSAELNIPIIASGGAGEIQDFTKLFQTTRASAGLAASIFHFREILIPKLKLELHNQKIPIRCI